MSCSAISALPRQAPRRLAEACRPGREREQSHHDLHGDAQGQHVHLGQVARDDTEHELHQQEAQNDGRGQREAQREQGRALA
jgi:hypothetical protein